MIHKISTKDMPRGEWLKARKKGKGGSDAAAILGLNPYKTAFDVYADKTGLVDEVKDSEAMRQGRDLEEYVAKRFTEETGKRVRRDMHIIFNTDHPYSLANIDRAVVGENAGLECKTTSVLNLKRYERGEYPDEYYCQCMHYMMVTGCERWYLAVLVLGKEFKIFTIERDEDEIQALAKSERGFWERYVMSRTAPPPSGSKSTDETIDKLHPRAADDMRADLSAYTGDTKTYAEIAARIKELETEKRAIEQKLKLFLGDMSAGANDNCRISWRNYTRSELDTKRLIDEFVPDGTDLDEYRKNTTYRKFIFKEEK